MHKIPHWIIIWTGVLVGSLVCSFTAEAFPRDVKWKQSRTDHFIIIYAEKHRPVAKHVAGMAESIHQDMSRFLGFTDDIATYVILTDHIDTFDRFNLEVLRKPDAKRIILHLGDMTAGAPSFDLQAREWLIIQFIYQYTYIMRRAMNSVFRAIVSAVYPDIGSSGWMDGGMALYMVTLLEGGSGRSPYLDMLIRTDLLEATLETLEQRAAAGYQTWPGDLGMFLYGYSFLYYLSETYGAERLAELNQKQSDMIPQPFERDTFKTVYGKSFDELQQEWRTTIQNRYQAQIETIRSRPLTTSQPLSESGYFSGSPLFSPAGKYVYYIEDSPHDDRTLIQLRLADRKRTRLTQGNFSGSFSLSADGQRIYFCKTEVYHAYYLVSDLYLIDLKTRDVTRLTKGARAFDPAISPDGNSLVYVTTNAGDMKLMKLDLNGGQRSTLFSTSNYQQIRHPAFSSDGTQLAVQILGTDGQQDIYIMTSEGTNLHPILSDSAIDASPSWGGDDRYLFFNSDRSGVPNIFAYALNEQRLYQVTNVLTGSFDPMVSRDGKQLVFKRYSSEGMNIHLAEIDPQQWLSATPTAQVAPPRMATERLTTIATGAETRYKPLPTLWIPVVFPLWGIDEDGLQFGANFSGEDVLGRDTYSLSLLYGIESGRMEIEAEYLNNRFYPTIGVFGYDRSLLFSDLFRNPQGFTRDYWERQQGAGIEIGIPLYRTRRTDLYFTTGFEYREIASLTEPEDLRPPLPDEGTLNNVSVRFILESLDRYRFSISPESGFLASARYRRYDEIFGSDFNINEGVGDLNFYLPTPFRHHVLFLRGAGGISDGDTLNQGLFQLGGFFTEFESTIIYEPRFYLRGYKRNIFSGDQFMLGTAEYRFPLWYVQRATFNGLLFWNSIAASLFVEAGHAWEDAIEEMDLKYSAGGELNLNIGYRYGRLPLGIHIGVAHGFDEDDGGETQIYFRFKFNI